MIADLRRVGENVTAVEVKRGAGGVPSLGRTLSAFGNMPDGGLIIIGLDAGEGFVPVGLADPGKIAQGVASQARSDALFPHVTVDVQIADFEGSQVVLCEVAGLPLPERPCRYEGVAYLRQFDGDYRMSDVEIRMIEDRQRHSSLGSPGWLAPDAIPVPGSSVEHFDADVVASVVENTRRGTVRYKGRSDEEVLYDLGALDGEGRATVAGLYVLGSFPQRFEPSWGASAAVQLHGEDGVRSRDLFFAEGSVPEMFSDLMDWAARNISDEIAYRRDGHAIDVPGLPAVAVREIIANALVHRDLSENSRGKSVNIRLNGRRLIVTNPGGLRGITTDQLGQQDARRPVNEHVYRLCTKYRFPDGARLIEGEGGGIRWVRKTLADADLIPPKFHDKGVSFAAIITKDSLVKKEYLEWLETIAGSHSLTREQRFTLLAMCAGEVWSHADACRRLKIDSVAARSMLQDLVARGLVSADGRGRATVYLLASAEAHPRPGGGMLPTGEAVLAWLEEAGEGSVADLAGSLPLTERQVRYALAKLEGARAVTHDGGRPALWRAK
ncbi:ATP-binding protein [Corynebacterium mastitidis]